LKLILLITELLLESTVDVNPGVVDTEEFNEPGPLYKRPIFKLLL
jgi:hypothetical protein